MPEAITPATGGRRSPWGRLSAAATAVALTLGVVLVAGGVAESSSTELRAVAPARLLDTRPGFSTVDGVSQGTGRVAAGTVIELQVAGRGGLPGDATAAMLNLTAVLPSGAGFLTAYPCGPAGPPATSTVNYGVGDVVANATLVGIGTGGRVCVFTLAATDVLVDVTGYVPTGGTPVPLVPARLLESRPGFTTVDGQQNGIGRRAATSITAVAVAGRAGVPATASAVLLNVTAIQPSAGGFLSVYPCGPPPPGTSSVNYGPGDVVPNAVLAAVGADGKVCVFTLAATDLIVDVTAYVPAGGTPGGLLPARILDSRPGEPTTDGRQQGIGRRPAASVTEVEVGGRAGVPTDASAVLLNVTAVSPSGAGFLTVYQCGAYRPNASTVNYGPGDVVPNAVLAQVGAGARVCIFTLAAADLVVDVTGFVPAIDGVTDTSVAPATTAPPVSPPGTGAWEPITTFGGIPVRWDPCYEIPFQIDPDGATAEAIQDLFAAIAEVERATGLDFVYAGTYTATYTVSGSRLRPSIPTAAAVGFTFADLEVTSPGLLGFAYTRWWGGTGEIFEGTVTVEDSLEAGGVDSRLVLMHEIAHLVGLDHFDDPGQLMQPTYDPGLTGFGPGDLQGLWSVGAAQGCFPSALTTGRTGSTVLTLAG